MDRQNLTNKHSNAFHLKKEAIESGWKTRQKEPNCFSQKKEEQKNLHNSESSRYDIYNALLKGLLEPVFNEKTNDSSARRFLFLCLEKMI